MTITQPLRDEHAGLYPHVAALAEAGDAVGGGPLEQLQALVDGSYRFLDEHLIPHARTEEKFLYPAVNRAVGAAEMTATMERDHVEVIALTEELAELRTRLAGAPELDEDLARALRRVLYGLHALVKVHFAKEEEVYLPILDDKLSAHEAHELFEAMHGAEHAHH
jgi:hemerythrin-like domain-containing protein